MQSAASQSQHVVNILTSGDPVNAGDVEKVEAEERNNNNTGLLAKGGATAKVQVKFLLRILLGVTLDLGPACITLETVLIVVVIAVVNLEFTFCTALQGAESQLSQVADRKLADKDVINQGDATQIARAEAKLNDGQIPPNSISAKAQV